MLLQIPDFPASDGYPLLVTFIIYTLVLLSGFIAFARYAVEAIRKIAGDFTNSLSNLLDENKEQTKMIGEIHEAVIEDTKPIKSRIRKRGV